MCNGYSSDVKILGVMVQNLVVVGTWRPAFVQLYHSGIAAEAAAVAVAAAAAVGGGGAAAVAASAAAAVVSLPPAVAVTTSTFLPSTLFSQFSEEYIFH
jgi:hypothetical protein